MPIQKPSQERIDQIREVYVASGYNKAEASRRLGIARSTIHPYVCDLEPPAVGALPLAPATPSAPAAPQEPRDAAFWRKKASEEGKRANEAEHIAREIAGVFHRGVVIPDWVLPSNTASSKAVGLIHLSDLHVGEVVRSEEIGGVNEYNPDIFKRRLRRMIAASIAILPRWASDCKMQGVVVALNGDLVSGGIHDELRRTDALTSHEQVNLAADELSAAIRHFADAFGAVMVTVTP